MHVFIALVPAILLLNYGIYMANQQPPIRTTTEIKNEASALDKSDAIVYLRGRITEQITKDEYWFEDESGKIRIELEDNIIKDFRLDPEKTVIIGGEVDYDELEGTEIEVSEILEAIK